MKSNEKMLLLAFFLVPVAFANVQERIINNYVVKIDGSTLKSVESTGTSSRVLNLSGLTLHVLENNVFDNLTTVKNLNLSNNSLSSIPKGLFSKLGNLEHLSLADNNITKFKKSFKGLNNLKTLNISNNPVRNFEGTDLFGLPKSILVFTKGLSLSTINANVFEKKKSCSSYEYEEIYDEEDDNEEDKKPQQDQVGVEIEKSEKDDYDDDNEENYADINKYVPTKICIHENVLKIVKPLKKHETLPSGCQMVNLTVNTDYLPLDYLSIGKFKKGWYQLDKRTPILRINFSGNKIVQVTPELLNDLPSSACRIDLSRNKIERLNQGIIKNMYIRDLYMDFNGISEIEPGALENMPELKELSLNENLLTDTKFAATLPININILCLDRNRITEITPRSFSRLANLNFLLLGDNIIQEVKSNSLQGLFNLKLIRLSNNRLTKIEPGSFRQTDLLSLDISNNSIAGFEKGVIDNKSLLTLLDTSYNKFSNIKENFPDGLPPNLRSLKLDFNEINKLERDILKNAPIDYLSLSGNNISEIELGSFDLQHLETLILDKTQLNELDINLFQSSLKRLETLSLDDNGITSIPRGFTKNMPKLEILNLSNNPIKRLQNGSLYGFRRTANNVLHLNNVPVEVIEGGLFDDI